MKRGKNQRFFRSAFFTKNQRGQVTIFIIAGIILIGAIGLFFVFQKGFLPQIGEAKETNPASYMDSCLSDKIKESIKLISIRGGYMENSLSKIFKFEDENTFYNISYLCYNQNYYSPCVNQQPMLIRHLKQELEKSISEDVRECFDSLTSSFEKQLYVVDAKYNGFDVELMPDKVVINIDSEIVLTKDGTTKQDGFKINVPTKFYNLALVVQEIVSQEARFCHFDYLGYMMIYRDFDIDKFRTGDLDTIYSVSDRYETKEMFRFAIRGCTIPPGI